MPWIGSSTTLPNPLQLPTEDEESPRLLGKDPHTHSPPKGPPEPPFGPRPWGQAVAKVTVALWWPRAGDSGDSPAVTPGAGAGTPRGTQRAGGEGSAAGPPPCCYWGEKKSKKWGKRRACSTQEGWGGGGVDDPMARGWKSVSPWCAGRMQGAGCAQHPPAPQLAPSHVLLPGACRPSAKPDPLWEIKGTAPLWEINQIHPPPRGR